MPRCRDAASWTLSISPSASRALSRISGVLSGDVHARFLGPTFRSALHSHSFRCFACFLSAKFIASFVSGHYLYEYVYEYSYRATPLWRFSFSYFSHCQWYIIGQVVVATATSPIPMLGSGKKQKWHWITMHHLKIKCHFRSLGFLSRVCDKSITSSREGLVHKLNLAFFW